jgi:hypothetical protein
MTCRLGTGSAALVVASAALLAGSAPARAAESPAVACLAASSASLKSDNEHRLRDERAELLACAAPTCPADIRNECIRRVDEVNLALPTIIFDAKDEAGNDLSAVKVTMDREVLADRLDGIAIAVDPGAHTFIFETAGRPTVKKQFVIRQSQKNRSELITFVASAPRSASATPAATDRARSAESHLSASPAASSGRSLPLAEAASPSSARKTVTIVAATLGVVGIGLGAVFGWQALSKRDDAQKICPTVCADEDGVRMWQDARRAGNISTGAFIAGGVGLAGAALLWLTASPERPVAPSAGVDVGPGQVTMALRGRW